MIRTRTGEDLSFDKLSETSTECWLPEFERMRVLALECISWQARKP